MKTAPLSTLRGRRGSLHLVSQWVRPITQRLVCSKAHRRLGPLIGRWNLVLERHFPLRGPSFGGRQGKVSLKALGKRVAADQALMYVLLL